MCMDTMNLKFDDLQTKYQPIPFWSWNDQLESEELRRQIRWMKANGIGGFFMHARGGLKTPYLEQAWMQAVEDCCDEAENLGMHAWAYDENGWPSGFAGGKLLDDPNNRDRYLTYNVGRFDKSADITYLLTDDQLLRTTEEQANGNYLNVYIKIAASTVDILNPEVVREFLQITHAQYKAHFGNSFSAKVAGFFTDEPQYYRAATPYTPMLAEYFREQYDMDIADQLGLLFVEKEGFQTFRYRYWLAMQTLMLNSFAKQVYHWCDSNGIMLTGHYVEEPSMGGQLMCCAGVMPFYEYEHIPGIDWLGSETDNEISPRQLNSAAQQLGKKQAITESFACCGWNISPADLKRIAGFQYACGVNLLCHHLLPYSEHGQRKKDYPAHFNPINPWVKDHFKEFNDYFSRLGYLLSNSHEPVNVALLHPMRSAYLHYQRGSDAGAIPESELDPTLREACRTLSARGIGYHFLDETLLEKHGFVDGATIGCGQCTYQYLVLPKMLTMGKHTEHLLQQFIANGGKVLLLDEKPAYLEGEPFDYNYLHSNTPLVQLEDDQPFCMTDPDTELYCTYRIFHGTPFMFVQNASSEATYTQTFSFQDNIQSFFAYDLITGETKQLPLTITFTKNESMLLFPSSKAVEPQPDKPVISVRLNQAAVAFDHNFLVMDIVSYSKDGLHFSDNMLCSDLFQLLLTERYEGQLWLRYEFDVRTPPKALRLLAEHSNSPTHTINGHTIVFDKALTEEPCVRIADISPYVQAGINRYETMLHWHQSEATYYALFGEGVTESLKNCIAYDSELEPVYLAGAFGVYSDKEFSDFGSEHLLGSHFYLDSAPTHISEPVTDGLPFFRGNLTLKQTILLDDPNTLLSLDGDYLTAKVHLNHHYVGELFFRNTLDISAYAVSGENELQVTFTIGNRNLLGPFHSQEQETFICPDSFTRNDLPIAELEFPQYKLRRFYPV